MNNSGKQLRWEFEDGVRRKGDNLMHPKLHYTSALSAAITDSVAQSFNPDQLQEFYAQVKKD